MSRKIIATELSSDFRKATSIVTAAVKACDAKDVEVETLFLGANASDVNFTAGKYLPGVKPPFDVGFEAIGVVRAVGSEVQHLKVGDAVAVTAFGVFAERVVLAERFVFKLPSPSASFLPLIVSGITASIAFEQSAPLKSGQTVLVTAAAGGTGVFAVQLAHLAGAHVIGTCSSDDKVQVLKKLGCNRVINYKKESLAHVLKSEYPSGVDTVYESVGGEFFDICLNALAVRGTLIVIGAVAGYRDGSAWQAAQQVKRSSTPLNARLLAKSTGIRGFFLNHFPHRVRPHLAELGKLVAEGKLNPLVDATVFVGLEQVADAIDHMYAGKNTGKVVIRMPAAAKL